MPEIRSLYLATNIRKRRPLGRMLADPSERGVAGAKLAETPLPAPLPPEAPLQTFSVALATVGAVTFPATGNFLRFNSSTLGTDKLTVRLKNGAGDTSNAPVSLFPGQRIRGRRFTHVEVTVPASLTGTAEFIYSTLPATDRDVDIL